MALILARKIRQYRSIVSILQRTIQETSQGARNRSANTWRENQGRWLATQFPTGPALLVSFWSVIIIAAKETEPPFVIRGGFSKLQAASTS
jgi:hypothetical protein